MTDAKTSLTGKYLTCNKSWEAHRIDNPNAEVFTFIEAYMKGYDDAKYLYELGDIDAQQEAEDNHLMDIEITDREAPTINQLEAYLNPNPDHKHIADINEFNQAWTEAEHQANVYYHDTGD